MKKIILTILTLSLCLYFCVQGKKTEQTDEENNIVSNPLSNSVEVILEDRLLIKSVSYNTKNLNSATDLIATPVLQNSDQDMGDVEYQFRWFVGNQEIIGVSGDTLENNLFKKNDWIYCRVKAVKAGKLPVTFRANYIRIPNSPPMLELASVPNFALPGTFNYKIVANDPDLDPLKFTLLSPFDKGIVLEQQTGELTWKLDAEMLKQLGEYVEIKFSVSDNDGGIDIGAITLNFSRSKKNR